MTNKLMEISITNDNESLPNLAKLGYQSKQFYSFKHKSIQDIQQESPKKSTSLNGDLDFNTLFENSVSSGSNENLNASNDLENEHLDSDSDSFKSIEQESSKNINIPESTSKSKPKPIPSRQNMSNTVYVCKRNDNMNMNESITRKSIEIIDSSEEYISTSFPLAHDQNGSLSNSFKEYLSSSYNFLKMSYNYLKTI